MILIKIDLVCLQEFLFSSGFLFINKDLIILNLFHF